MVPHETTVAVVEEELLALSAYAGRHGWAISWLEKQFTVIAAGPHPADHSPVRLQADVKSYRAFPPTWTFLPAADTDPPQKAPFPKAGTLPGGGSSIFHTQRVICAPFNMLAYKTHGGPHGDWGGPAAWLDVRGGHIRATKLAEMLAQIRLHLRYSPGWLT
jgi:hypothetical protein